MKNTARAWKPVLVAGGVDSDSDAAALLPLSIENYDVESGEWEPEECGTIQEGETWKEALDRNGYDAQPIQVLRPFKRSAVVYALYQKRSTRPREFLIAGVIAGDRVDRFPDCGMVRGLDTYCQLVKDKGLVALEVREAPLWVRAALDLSDA